MLVVIDTNVLIAIVPSKSIYNIVYKMIMQEKFDIVVSNEIILEYEEQLKYRYHFASIEEELESLLKKVNVQLSSPTFFWNLIPADADDNKFVDCAIATNADYIITNDTHFNVLKNISFPKVNTLTLQEFIQLLQR